MEQNTWHHDDGAGHQQHGRHEGDELSFLESSSGVGEALTTEFTYVGVSRVD